MTRMSPESWLKIALPGFPVAFIILVNWVYWGENPLPLLPPSVAFWGFVILYYLFTNLYIAEKPSLPLILTGSTLVLWFAASLTSHSLGRFLLSDRYYGLLSILSNKDFLIACLCALVSFSVGIRHFCKYEPLIRANSQKDRPKVR